jgi:RimJ/RimL family protein N-acetyltransferase
MTDTITRTWQHPDIQHLEGRYVRIDRLDPDRDIDDLYALSHEPPEYQELFKYLFTSPFESKAAMHQWLKDTAGGADPMPYSVWSKEHNRRVGMISVMNIAPAHARAELGSIWYSPLAQRSKVNTEVTYLFLRALFDEYGYRRVEWKCDNRNEPSKRTAQRMGFLYEGLFRQHMIIKGQNRDTAWFALLDSDWPFRRANFEAYLAGEAESLARLNGGE